MSKSQSVNESAVAKLRAEVIRRTGEQIDSLSRSRSVPEAHFLNACRLLSKKQYLGVVDERTSDRMCGMPTCAKNLDGKPAKDFNCTYRLTKDYAFKSRERKGFCSNDCFFASLHALRQLKDRPASDLLDKPLAVLVPFSGLTFEERVRFKLSSVDLTDGVRMSKEEINKLLKSGAFRNPNVEKNLPMPKDDPTASKKRKRKVDHELDSESLYSRAILDEVGEDAMNAAEKLIIVERLETPSRAPDVQNSEPFSGPECVVRVEKSEPPRYSSSYEKILAFAKEWCATMVARCYVKWNACSKVEIDDNKAFLSLTACSNTFLFRQGVVKNRLNTALDSMPISSVIKNAAIRFYSELCQYLDFSNKNVLLDGDEWAMVALALLEAFSFIDENIKDFTSGGDFHAVLESRSVTYDQVATVARVFMNGSVFSTLKGMGWNNSLFTLS